MLVCIILVLEGACGRCGSQELVSLTLLILAQASLQEERHTTWRIRVS